MRKFAIALVFLTIVLSVWTAGNLYLARHLAIEPAWPEPIGTLVLWAIALLALLPFAQPFLERTLGARRSRWIAWPGYVYMGLALFFVIAFGISDLLLGLAGAALASGAASDGATALAQSRVEAIVVTLVVLSAGAVALASGRRAPALRRVEIPLAKWPAALDGFRIVQVSDVHIGAILDRSFAEHIVERVNALTPDLIAVTGDLVDGSVPGLARDVAPFAGLRARHGVFFVTGNHDYYSGADPWIAHLKIFGWRVLRNERVAIEQGGAAFDLAGVDDHHASLFGGDHGEDVPRALAGRDPARAIVLLAHDPSTFKRASQLGIDLQLSGHTHGGQIWPFGYFVKLFVPFVAGQYERNGARVLVSCGTGFWGPPMRLGAPSEITEIVLRATGLGDASPQ